MRQTVRASLLLAAVGVAPLHGCAEQLEAALGEQGNPNVILITLDTTRLDRLTCYGYGRQTTPFLDTLADRSLVFDNAFSPATWTLPAHVSMLSGLAPYEHGCWPTFGHTEQGTPLRTVSKEVPLVTDAFVAAGYRCVAAVGGPFTSTRYGVLRGFADFLEPTDSWELGGADINRWIFEELTPGDEEPLFLFVNYFDAHAPYAAPDDGRYPFQAPSDLTLEPVDEDQLNNAKDPAEVSRLRRIALEQYDRELFVQDQNLEELMTFLEEGGWLEDAIVLVTSDHGEMFGENGLFGHGCNPFDAVAHVPLLVYSPSVPAGRTDRLVSTAGIARTVLEFAEVAGPPFGRDGDNLLLVGEIQRLPYMENRSAVEWVGAVRSQSLKYATALQETDSGIEHGPGITLDLSANPDEDLLLALPDGVLEDQGVLRSALLEMTARWATPPSEHPTAALSDDERARLEALGY